MSEEQHDVQVFGHRLPQAKERKFLLFAGIVGIAGVLMIVYNQRRTAVGAPLSSFGPSEPGAASSSGGSSSGTTTPPPPILPDIELKFSEDTSPMIGVGGASGGGGGFGFSIGGFGFSLGGSSSHQSQNQLAVQNHFETDTIIHNADPGTLNSVLDWLTGLAGTQEERAAQAQHELDQLYPYAHPGHTINGIVEHEEAQQSFDDLQRQIRLQGLMS